MYVNFNVLITQRTCRSSGCTVVKGHFTELPDLSRMIIVLLQAELSQSRRALTEMLMELFMQQSQRRKELIESLRRIEDAKNSETFWLEMYHKLLHSKSQQLAERLRKIDPDLANEFFSLGIFHYLPVLGDVLSSDVDLEALTPSKLSEVRSNCFKLLSLLIVLACLILSFFSARCGSRRRV